MILGMFTLGKTTFARLGTLNVILIEFSDDSQLEGGARTERSWQSRLMGQI